MKTQLLHWSSKTINAALTMGALLLFTHASDAANRPGLGAPAFTRWSATSTSNFVNAVNSASPANFELNICPFFGSNFDNVSQFLAKVNASKVLTAHMSFHTDQSGWNLADRSRRWSNYLTTASTVLGGRTPLQACAYIPLSWQLEDGLSDAEWRSKVTEMLGQMSKTVLGSGKLTLRRSIMKQGSSLNNTTFPYSRDGVNYSFKVYVEYHGFSQVRPAHWSNDGQFVYFPDTLNQIREANDSITNSEGAAKTLTEFNNVCKAFTGSCTLWRPAYNVWRRSDSGGVRRWVRNGDTWTRVDSFVTFDAREAAVLRNYINAVKQ